jgi:hypothetical protein
MDKAAIGQWLEDHLDSHGIYDLKWVTEELTKVGYTGSMPGGLTQDQMFKSIEARGLGGELDPEEYPGQLSVAGYIVAGHVTRVLLGEAPGDKFFGRGSAFRANVSALKAA